MEIIYTDALILGGGLAGLRTAIGVKRRGNKVIVLSLVPSKRSHSAAAQGGMQASLANCAKGCGDNEDRHFDDTIRGSDWGADQIVARMFVHTAPKAIRELASWGVPWNRVQQGKHDGVIDAKHVSILEPKASHGLITARNFGGTQKWRTCFVSDGTGHSMLYTMSNQAIAENIPVHERMEAISLIHDGKHCQGAVVRNLITGQLVAYIAKATCISTGGFGRIYRSSTNAIINEGIGAAIALETGIAPLANMEAVQFHPTAIFPAGILVTEGCRGDGGILLDKNLHRFMPDYEPEKKELASRDVVARRMETHIAKGYGVHTRFGDHLWLDIRLLGKEHIDTHLREVKEICQNFLGIDPTYELIPVKPAQHYSMGGIRTKPTGESVGLNGLFATGEAACWDMHGFNRLGGNSVAETVVSGMIAGEYMSDFLSSKSSDITLSTERISQCIKTQKNILSSFIAEKKNPENAFIIQREMQDIMSQKVGIFRDAKNLQEAVNALIKLQSRAKNIVIKTHSLAANPELVTAYRVQKMLKLSMCVALGALKRTESRGAHYREDFPLRNDLEWLSRTLATWPSDANKPELTYENLNIKKMEMPPGWRGYGTKECIQHPDTDARKKEISRIKHTKTNADIPSKDSQHLLMPFLHWLPEKFRGDNQRINDPEIQKKITHMDDDSASSGAPL